MNDERMPHEEELRLLAEAARIHAMTFATPNLRLEDVHDLPEDGRRLHPVEPAAILERITRTRDCPSERERETEDRTQPWNVTNHATLNRTTTLRDGCTEAEDFTTVRHRGWLRRSGGVLSRPDPGARRARRA